MQSVYPFDNTASRINSKLVTIPNSDPLFVHFNDRPYSTQDLFRAKIEDLVNKNKKACEELRKKIKTTRYNMLEYNSLFLHVTDDTTFYDILFAPASH
jgi:hypothetical protein